MTSAAMTPAAMTSADRAADGAFDEFDMLVCTIAGGAPVGRSEATRWSDCRSALLAGGYRDCLPGFVIQCGSVFKYREFIALYHPDLQMREEFVRKALGSARARNADRAGMEFVTPEGRGPKPLEWSF